MEYEIEPNESVSTAVVCAVSAVEGRDEQSLQPLTNVLDPDALNRLFDECGDDAGGSERQLTFVFSTCRVTVHNGEYLTINPIDPRAYKGRGPDAADAASR